MQLKWRLKKQRAPTNLDVANIYGYLTIDDIKILEQSFIKFYKAG